MSGSANLQVQPAEGERGLASWEAADLSDLLLPAWDDFLDLVAALDLDEPSRLTGWTVRDICVHLGSWPGSRSLLQMRAEASRASDDPGGRLDRGSTFDQDSHNEAVLEAWAAAPRSRVLEALDAAREETADYLSSDDLTTIGARPVRSMLGPLPLTTLVAAGAYELAVHALDLAPAGARPPTAALLCAGLAGLVDTTGALTSRLDLTAHAACLAPGVGWAFAATPAGWTTLELPELPETWPAVHGTVIDLLDASCGRRAIPAMLTKRELRMHHVNGLLALAPLVEAVPGLPGGAALRTAVRNLRAVSRLLHRIPGMAGNPGAPGSTG